MATYKPLQSVTLTSASSNITFSGIDQNYTDLNLVINGQESANQYVAIRFNGSSGAYYSQTRLFGDGTTAFSDRQTGATFGRVSVGDPSNLFSTLVSIPNYSNSSTYKSWISRSNIPSNYVGVISGLWLGSTGSSTEAITSITITTTTADTFLAGTTVSLYGIKAGTPKAVGGDVVTTDGTYWYHAFKNSGTFAVQQGSALTADYLLVAGGGGGGGAIAQNYSGSGGGAGGLRLLASQTLVAGTEYTVLVGAGGLGVLSDGTAATQGGNSSFGTASVTGGGKGANGSVGSWGNGGSGGGATADGGSGSGPGAAGGLGNAGNYSPVEGYNGGTGWYSGTNKVPGGGGGGAGGVGGNASDGVGGNGGAGTNAYNSVTFTTWLTQTGTGVSGYLAGGGGGGSRNGGTAGSGGSGGGGAGAVAAAASNGPTAGNNATANTGSGGGGGGPATSGSVSYKGGNGGSGLVIVRYAV